MADPIGFIGLGQIGQSLASRLLDLGYDLLVWNRTASRSEAFAARFPGRVRVAASAQEAAAGVERLFLCMLDEAAVRAVMEGPDGALAGLRPGSLALNFTTVHPSLSEDMARQASAKGAGYLDSSFSGGAPQAADGTLTLMVGGDAVDYERVKDLLNQCGSPVFYLGPAGSGSLTKILNNALAATCLAASGEAMVAARVAGLDGAEFLKVILASSGSNFMLERMHRVLLDPPRGPVEETFSLRRFREYTHIPQQLAEERGLPQTVVAAADAVYRGAIEAGFGDARFAAFVLGIRSDTQAALDLP